MEIKKNAKILMDKALSKGMAILENEKVKKVLESKQVQDVMEFGLNVLAKAQEGVTMARSKIIDSLDLVSVEELKKVQDELAAVKAELAACKETEASEDKAEA